MPLPVAWIIGGLITIGSILWEGLKVSADILFKFVSIMVTHPLLGYFTILFLLFVDTATFGQTGFGLIGGVFSGVFRLLNLPKWVTLSSFQLLVILVIFPVIIFVLSKSRQPQK